MKELLLRDKKSTIKFFIAVMAAVIFVGYTFNDSAPYLIINCSLGNNIKIYFNTSSADNKIIYDEGTNSLTNVSGSQVSGYLERNGEQFQVYFPVFDTPYYRTTNNYTYVYITNVSIVKNHNVRFYRYIDDSSIMFGACAIILPFYYIKRYA